MNALSNDLGCRLFYDTRPLSLTAAGEVVLKHAGKIIGDQANMLAELRDGDSGWHWGSCHDPRLKEYYYAMTEAINDEQYIENSRNLQHLADEEMFGLTFAWQTGFFPYRTDKIEGWDNWQSWGVINARTWFDLTAK